MNDTVFQLNLATAVSLLEMRGLHLSGQALRELCFDDLTLSSLAEVTRSVGLPCREVQLSADELRHLPMPTLIRLHEGTFMLVLAVRPNSIECDINGKREAHGMAEVATRFAGEALEFTSELPAAHSPIRRVVKLLFQNPGPPLFAFAAALMIQFLGVILPQVTRVAVDFAFPNLASSLLNLLVVAAVSIALFQAWIGWLREKALIYFEHRIGFILERGFVEHVVRLPYGFLQPKTSGELLQAHDSLRTINGLLTSGGLAPFISFIIAGLYAASLVAILPAAATVLALLCALLLLGGLAGGLIQARLQRQELAASSAEQSVLVEMLTNIATVKAAAAEDEVLKKWLPLLLSRELYSLRRRRAALLSDTGLDLLQQVAIAVVLLWGAGLAIRGDLTAGAIIAGLQLTMGLLSSLLAFNGGCTAFINSAPAWDRVADLLRVPAEPVHAISDRTISGAIVLENVWFRYSESRPWVLRDFSLTSEPGRHTVLTAPSGFGKSTILRLIAGLYAPEQGRVTVSGVDPKFVRDKIAYLPQFTSPISGSILQNLRFFSHNASMDRLMAAAVDTGLDQWVSRLPMGYETMFISGAPTLSGGQRQLIALTGVLASDRPVLLLDEFVSCLDPAARAQVLSSKLLDNRSVVFADHVPMVPS